MKKRKYRRNINKVMKGGVVCGPCIAAASGFSSGKLMLGAAAGISSATAIRSKRRKKRKKRIRTKKRTKTKAKYRRKTKKKSSKK